MAWQAAAHPSRPGRPAVRAVAHFAAFGSLIDGRANQRNGDRADQLWYKDAIIYQLHVKSFFDSNDDGIGDFPGLISKLDYIADLGVNVIWLLPFYPSPRLDDGYDISAYREVHPDYGTLADFRHFVRAAHARNIRVITELVVNHTSDQHPWFQRARRAKPGLVMAQFLRLVRDRPEIYRHAHHLSRCRAVELDVGSGRRRVLLASLLLASARSEFRQSECPEGGARRDALLAATRGRRIAARCRALSCRARRDQQ